MKKEQLGDFLAREYPEEEAQANPPDLEWLRDQFAMAALSGLIRAAVEDPKISALKRRRIFENVDDTGDPDLTAPTAYHYADAMLEARKQQRGVQHDSSGDMRTGG